MRLKTAATKKVLQRRNFWIKLFRKLFGVNSELFHIFHIVI